MIIPFYPFSLLYNGITWGRNLLYEHGVLHSVGSDRMLICVGNLSVGGTGKTPMVEYLVRLLQEHYPLATLSRGYGRKTRGFRLAGAEDTALTLGDEPYQYYRKWHNQLPVAVGEDRVGALVELLNLQPEVQVVLLDDAYQHRRVQADINLLLTSYDQPFWKDWVLPAGRLRENRQGAKRAQALVITKCPEPLSPQEQEKMRQAARPYLAPETPVFFATIGYEAPVPLTAAAAQKSAVPGASALLLSGLAKPAPFEAWVAQHYQLLKHLKYGDHYAFQPKDLERLRQEYEGRQEENLLILTSEKDAARLYHKALLPLLEGLPVYYIPIRQRFVGSGTSHGAEAFNALVLKSVAEKLGDES